MEEYTIHSFYFAGTSSCDWEVRLSARTIAMQVFWSYASVVLGNINTV